MPLHLLPTTDADIVRSAIRHAGRDALLFDTAMVETEIEVLGGLSTSSIASLRRHLAAHERAELLIRIESRLPLVFDEEIVTRRPMTLGRGSAAPARGRYLLAERVHELREANPAHLDDQTRTVVALQLAQFMLGGASAPTRLVTHVLQTVPALRICTIQDTNVLLQQLSKARGGLVAREVVRDRSVRWSITGKIRAAWLRWVMDAFEYHRAALEGPQRVAAAGGASRSELARDLVSACARRTSSAMWPKGRPVSLREISAVLASVRGAGDTHDVLWGLQLALEARKGGVQAAIHEAARAQFSDGSRRRQAAVEKVVHPAVPGVAYATSELAADVTSAWLQWQRLKEEAGRAALARLTDEWRAMSPNAASDDPTIAALQACQRVAVARVADALRDDGHRLLSLAESVSTTLRTEAEERLRAIVALRSTWPTSADLQRDARRQLRPLGFTLDAVLNAPRPQISADEYAALLPSSQKGDLAASVLVANLSGVRRDRAVEAEAPITRVGAGRAALLKLDRVDAVIAAVETASLPAMQQLTAAGRILGRRIAHLPLVRRLASSEAVETRLVGLAALVLLGDVDHAETLVQRLLRDPRALDHLGQGVALIELSWWLSRPLREAVMVKAKGHPMQVIARVAREVRMAAAGR